MGGCNATINVLIDADKQLVQSLACVGAHQGDDHYSRGVSWRDTSPGATPHHEADAFYVQHSGIKWTVIEMGKRIVADFYGGPETAGSYAQEFCDWMNGKPSSPRAERDRYREALEHIHDWAALGGEHGAQPDARIMQAAKRVLDGVDV